MPLIILVYNHSGNVVLWLPSTNRVMLVKRSKLICWIRLHIQYFMNHYSSEILVK